MIKKEKCSENRIKYFSISFFAIILGLVGLTLAFQKAEEILHLSINISMPLLIITIVAFAIVSFFYVLKMIKYSEEVKQEFNHPIKLKFF